MQRVGKKGPGAQLPPARWVVGVLICGATALAVAQEAGGAGSGAGTGEVGSGNGVADGIEANPYSISISESLQHDSNVLHAPAGRVVSDIVSNTDLRLGLDQWLGRQRLDVSADLQYQRFRDSQAFNNLSPILRAQLDWSTAERWQGQLGLLHQQSLYRNFLGETEDGSSELLKNLERIDEGFFRANLGLVTAWTVEGALTAFQRRYSADASASSELDRRAVELGVRYRPHPDFSFRTLLRYTDGRYPHGEADGEADRYDRRDLEASLQLRPSGASSLVLRLAHSNEHHHQGELQRAQLWSGSLSWKWQPTGKLSFDTQVLRDSDTGNLPLSEGQASRDVQLGTEFSIASRWQASEKLQFSLNYQQSLRDLQRGQGTPDALSAKDRQRRITLKVDWRPSRGLALGCQATPERRQTSGSAELTTPYDATVVGCYGRFVWQ
ncbi:hypothetical protein LRH25_17130 [Ideonella azotifigens]|uniref:TIGR03016 family PEP-CTERM system-associated outer membrane protein n=1 Tax=Ideonella azotifigens TaxID=513160 RepID=A0ABN1JIK4_9BURK|nr:hypothetical protein [Ideonella azotifigens]MCD2342066.1 hypothetical protein [Ideonella azotifigens]